MNYKQFNNHLRLLSAGLELEETIKVLCPQCEGGTTNEISFSITRQLEGVVYNCYRASCACKGFMATHGLLLKPSKKKQKIKHYYHPVLGLQGHDQEYFKQRFDISPNTSVFSIWRSKFDEYIFPVINLRGLTRGYNVRQPNWKGNPRPPRKGQEGKPKSRIFPSNEEPMQSFHGLYSHDSRLIVVEDQVSALRVAECGFICVALCGVEANVDKIREWAQVKPSEVIIALDKDATSKAFKMARKWGLAFPKIRVAMLEKDLKDELDISDIPDILGLS